MSITAAAGRAVFILGMHRSGTSCLAGCLEECGLALGAVNRRAPYNKKGNNENPRVMELHDALLRHNGGSWDRPPERLAWTAEHGRRRDEILSEYRGLRVFGIKDPRTLLTLDFWLEPGLERSFVATFRHPLAVAASLARRNRFSAARGLELWTTYNRLLLRWRERLSFELVRFDLPPRQYQASVAGAARALGLDPPSDPEGFGFFEPALRRDVPDRGPLPPETAEIYVELQRSSAVGVDD